jgi:hypothetical protein
MLGKIQKHNRSEINPEDVQSTGEYLLNIIYLIFIRFFFLGLPVWRDPFDRKKAG